MFSLYNLVLALSLLALVLSGVDAAPTVQRRAKCAVRKPSSNSNNTPASAINVAPAPTSAPASSASSSSSSAAAKPTSSAVSSPPKNSGKSSGCFPSANFNTPDGKPSTSLDNWWCDRSSEYAFMGFSYAVNSCPSKSGMTSDFKRMRNDFGARYVRIYAACDRASFNDDMVAAAYDAGIGIFALVWFGFDGGDIWKTRMNKIVSTIKNNDLAPYVIRNLAIGSEAMFDNAIPAGQLADTIRSVRGQVAQFGVQVSTSDMAYKWTANPNVISAADHIQSNTLPFFSGDATFGSNGIGAVTSDVRTYSNRASGKKIYLTQTGWPSNQSVWKANSASAVASVSSEKAYYDALDAQCAAFKKGPQGGVGWFAHIWTDSGLPGWGILGTNGSPKFSFKPRTSC